MNQLFKLLADAPLDENPVQGALDYGYEIMAKAKKSARDSNGDKIALFIYALRYGPEEVEMTGPEATAFRAVGDALARLLATRETKVKAIVNFLDRNY